MKKIFLSIKTGHLFGLGLVILFLSLVPTLILGVDSIVDYHDQLDGELIAYILQAKHLFSGNDFFPEFLGGVGQTALTRLRHWPYYYSPCFLHSQRTVYYSLAFKSLPM